MKIYLPFIISAICFVCLTCIAFTNLSSLQAQSELKIMCYNILTFPEYSGDKRVDTLAKIIDYYQPDLMLLQELKSENGLNAVVQEFNELPSNPDIYRSGTYEAQISNPSNDWRLQQNIVYNHSRFELLFEEVVTTDYRDINYFQLAVKDSAFLEQTDTTLLHVYVTHLKSSYGPENEQLRLGMAEFWMDHIETLPPNSNIIASGDFNIYSSSEPAYQLLTSTGTISENNTLKDPINMPNWSGSTAGILTQSTRLDSPGNGAGGGLDDRFDFVLLSENLMNGTTNIAYVPDTYEALGNNGTCYNIDLLDCNQNNDLPYDILRALWNMSDHLPVVLSLEVEDVNVEYVDTMDIDTTITIGINDLQNIEKQNVKIFPNPAKDVLNIVCTQTSSTVQVFDLSGNLVIEKPIFQNQTQLNIKTEGMNLKSGLYLLQIIGTDNKILGAEKLIIE